MQPPHEVDRRAVWLPQDEIRMGRSVYLRVSGRREALTSEEGEDAQWQHET
jgi:hypothetical protein